MSRNQQFDGSRFDGTDVVLNYADQPLTKAQLEAHPVWQYMLKRFEAQQIAANGPSIQEIEMSLGLAPVEYANWVKFNSKGKRIAWSQAVKRPKGPAWQPYTRPKHRSDPVESPAPLQPPDKPALGPQRPSLSLLEIEDNERRRIAAMNGPDGKWEVGDFERHQLVHPDRETLAGGCYGLAKVRIGLPNITTYYSRGPHSVDKHETQDIFTDENIKKYSVKAFMTLEEAEANAQKANASGKKTIIMAAQYVTSNKNGAIFPEKGEIDPHLIATAPGGGNYSTLRTDGSTQYWEYMDHGGPGGHVYHRKLDKDRPRNSKGVRLNGLPSDDEGGAEFNAPVYIVFVEPVGGFPKHVH